MQRETGCDLAAEQVTVTPSGAHMALSQSCPKLSLPAPRKTPARAALGGKPPHQHCWASPNPGAQQDCSWLLLWAGAEQRQEEKVEDETHLPHPSTAARFLAGSRIRPGVSHTSRSSPPAGFHPRAPQTVSGRWCPTLAAVSPPRAQPHPAGLEPNNSQSQERRWGEAAPSAGHPCPGQPRLVLADIPRAKYNSPTPAKEEFPPLPCSLSDLLGES